MGTQGEGVILFVCAMVGRSASQASKSTTSILFASHYQGALVTHQSWASEASSVSNGSYAVWPSWVTLYCRAVFASVGA